MLVNLILAVILGTLITYGVQAIRLTKYLKTLGEVDGPSEWIILYRTLLTTEFISSKGLFNYHLHILTGKHLRDVSHIINKFSDITEEQWDNVNKSIDEFILVAEKVSKPYGLDQLIKQSATYTALNMNRDNLLKVLNDIKENPEGTLRRDHIIEYKIKEFSRLYKMDESVVLEHVCSYIEHLDMNDILIKHYCEVKN